MVDAAAVVPGWPRIVDAGRRVRGWWCQPSGPSGDLLSVTELMEAAIPLFASTSVRVLGDRLLVDGLVVEDETAVRLAREAEDPARAMRDAIEIGARVLDREQTGAGVEY